MALLQKISSKAVQYVGKPFVFLISPVKCLLERLEAVVGIIFRINTITNDKYLDVLEQSITAAEGMTLIPVYLIECFFQFQTSAL